VSSDWLPHLLPLMMTTYDDDFLSSATAAPAYASLFLRMRILFSLPEQQKQSWQLTSSWVEDECVTPMLLSSSLSRERSGHHDNGRHPLPRIAKPACAWTPRHGRHRPLLEGMREGERQVG